MYVPWCFVIATVDTRIPYVKIQVIKIGMGNSVAL